MRVEDNIKDLNDLGINITDMAVSTEYNFHFLNIPFVSVDEIFIVGLDVGYSATKVYSMYGHHKFPSLIAPISEENLSKILFKKDSFIAYRDKNITNKTWLIGDIVSETEYRKLDDQNTLYSGARVGSDENVIFNRVGIALSLMNKRGVIKKNAEIKIAVGLPEEYNKYIDAYTEQLRGYHEFEIQIGKSDKWIPVSFIIKEENIDVLSQPFGTLLSIALNRQGRIIDQKLLEQNRIIIFDAGFLTVDTFVLQGGRTGECLTWETRAMKTIHEQLIDICFKQTKKNIGFHQINRLLSLPKEKRFLKYSGREWYFDVELNDLIDKMAKENVKKLAESYDDFDNIDIMVMTGGTSKVYYPYFIVGLPNLEIKLAEIKDALDPQENFDIVFANSVGFFNYVLMKYRAEINYKEQDIEKIKEAAVTKEG